MNKKFSTLVAALLVSGVSYAVVDAYNAPAMAESNVTMAVTADLRAAVTPGYELGKTDIFANGTKWSATQVAGGYTLRTVGKESYLCTGPDNAVIVSPTNEDAITFTVTADGYLKKGSDFLLINKTTGELTLGATINLQTQYYVGMFSTSAGTGLAKSSLATGTTDRYTMAAVVETAEAITNSQNMVKIATNSTHGIESAATGFDNSASSSVISAERLAEATPVHIVTIMGKKVLKMVTAKGTEAYIMSTDGTTLSISLDAPATADEAVNSEVTVGGTNNSVTIGTQANKSLILNSTYQIGTYDAAKGVALVNEAGTQVTDISSADPATTYYLAQIATNATTWGNATGNVVALDITGQDFSTTAYDGTDATAKLIYTATKDGFTLSSDADYLGAAATAVEKDDAVTFTLDDLEYGVIKSGTSYLVKNASVPTVTTDLSGGKTKLYLYKAGETTPLKSTVLETLADGAEVFVGEKNAAVQALTVTGTSIIVTAKEEPVVTPPVSAEPAKLIEGGNYYLQDNTKANCLIPEYDSANKTYKLGNVATNTIEEEDVTGLWKVTAVKFNTSGVATHYSFTYRNSDKLPLAFSVKYNKTTSQWDVAYDKDGKYNTFFVDQRGFISFVADETVNVKENTYTNKKQYALAFDVTSSTWSIAEYNELTIEKLNVKLSEDIVVTGDEVAEQVIWLNRTAGNGTGFGIAFVENDKKVTLEDCALTETVVTAVQGPNLTAMSGVDYSTKMFLRTGGSYAYKAAASTATAAEKEALAKAQLADFQASTFAVVDTVLYSKLIADDKPYYYLAAAKGSAMVSAKGKDASQATSYAELVEKDGGFVGLTRRVENAVFEVHHYKGSTIEDPVHIKATEVMMPVDKYNEKGLINASVVGGTDGYVDAAPLYVAIKNYDKKYYVGAADEASSLFITKNNDVDFNDVHGIVNIISRNYKTDGQVYANISSGDIDKVLAKYVSTDKPEGQYLVTGGTYNKYGEIQPFTFTNRESSRNNITLTNLDGTTKSETKISLKKTDKENIYSVVGKNDTIEIKSASTANEYVGYKHYTQNELKNTTYVLKAVSKAGGVDDLYITEDHNKDHSLGLHADTLESANFKLIKFEVAKSDTKLYGDTVYVSGVDAPYSYIKDKEYAEENDRVVAFTYAIYNADNKEFLDVNQKGSTLQNYYYCNPDLKYAGNDAEKNAAAAQRFIIKEKADGTIQLLPVEHINKAGKNIFEATTTDNPVIFNENVSSKLYIGLSDNKVYDNTNKYAITENDLFRVVPVGAPMYRTVDAAPFDTIRIYKEGMDNVALFAETADKNIVSGGHFLGMKHKADKDQTKTMFSFFVDTAYVNRESNYKPQYLLVIGADTLHKFEQCPIPTHGMEDTGRIDTVTGKFLTTMVDSIPAWGKNHSNPYWWEKEEYPRLGFVNAKHIGDDLIVLRDNGIQTKADTIKLDNNNDKAGVFAFRYVDQATKSFLMETKGGWVKWLNGVPVVVSKIEEAEVFNFQPTTNNPTSNDQIGTSEVSVIAGAGSVVVKGAAGKTVTVSNILGQAIATTVLTSDNATIAVPAGIVVVAVEGEEAVKTVVR